MSADATPSPVSIDADAWRERGIRTYLRGSSFLLSGRVLSLLINLAVQVVTVRVLTKHDYGAFAYALGMVSIASSAIVLGMDKTVARFVPLYQERGQPEKALGTLVLAAGLVWVLGLTVVLLFFGYRGLLGGDGGADPLAVGLVLVLIVLAPIQALDSLLQSVLAVFVGARAIFVRRHIVGPGLKLIAVLLVAAASGDVYLLAYGYVVGGLIGVALYLWILIRRWSDAGLLSHFRARALRIPLREVLGYSFPLLSSELLVLIPSSVAVIILAHFHASEAVAEYRAVLPVARLNQVVLHTFAMLYLPLASRMFARGDERGVNELYWQTATWVAVLTFPVFAMTVAFAEPLITLLFGTAYRSSAGVLAILAAGWYVHAAVGFNGYTLRVHGHVRAMVIVNLTAGGLGLAASIALIARFGAIGAALGSTLVLVLQNVLNQAALLIQRTETRALDPRFLRTAVIIIGMVGTLAVLERTMKLPLPAGMLMVALATITLIHLSREALQAGQAFPKLQRIPILRHLLERRAS